MKPIRKLLTDRKQALKTAKPKQRERLRQKYREALVVAQLRKESKAA
jgi:hypothetical protein